MVMVDNNPPPSGLENLLIEAGLISCGRNSLPVFEALLLGSGPGVLLGRLPSSFSDWFS